MDYNEILTKIGKDKFISDYLEHDYNWLHDNYNTTYSVIKKLAKDTGASALAKKRGYENRKAKTTVNKRKEKEEELKINCPKDKLYQYYIIENHSTKECCIHFNISNSALMKLISLYDIHKDHKTSHEISKKTKAEKYGDENYNNREKAAQTLLDTRGVDNIFKDSEFMKQVYLDTLGVDHPMHDPEIARRAVDHHDYEASIAKGRQTYKEKTGYDNPFKNPDVQAKNYIIRTDNNTKPYNNIEKLSATVMERYNVPFYCMTKECRSASSNDSKPNREFEQLLIDNHLDYEKEFRLGNYSYDFKVNDTLIEIDPTATHNTMWHPFDEPLTEHYHYDKSRFAEENGYRCIHIWDWDDKQKIINLLLKHKKIYARNCVIKEINTKTAKEFISKYHLQGYAKSKINIGLYYKDELVSVMTFGKPRYNKNYEYELIRYCSVYNIIGGAEKLFKHFLDTYKPKSVISYCDRSKFNGDTYLKLGFNLAVNCKISKHWSIPKPKKSCDKPHISNNLLVQRGFDQIFKTSYGKGTSNEQLMIEYGYVTVYDAGQSTYIYKEN